MDFPCSRPKSSVLLAAAFVLLSFQDAGAQTTRTTTADVPVPGWGIALLVMLSLMAALALVSLVFFPLWCLNTEYDCQDGVSFYSPRSMCKPSDPCNVHCEQPPDPCNVRCQRSPEPCNVRCQKSPEPSTVRCQKSPEPYTVRCQKSPEPYTVRCQKSPEPSNASCAGLSEETQSQCSTTHLY